MRTASLMPTAILPCGSSQGSLFWTEKVRFHAGRQRNSPAGGRFLHFVVKCRSSREIFCGNNFLHKQPNFGAEPRIGCMRCSVWRGVSSFPEQMVQKRPLPLDSVFSGSHGIMITASAALPQAAEAGLRRREEPSFAGSGSFGPPWTAHICPIADFMTSAMRRKNLFLQATVTPVHYAVIPAI